MRNLSALPLLVTFSLSFVACLGVDDSVGRNLGLGAVCGASGDCAANLECEVEHGVASCQPHGGGGDGARSDAATTTPRVLACRVDTDCAAGLECEVEHGLSVCQPHGGGTRTDSGATSSHAGGAAVVGSCRVDTDCAAGLECEVEHGVGVCQPHSGGSGGGSGGAADAGAAPADAPAVRGVGGACAVDLDCEAGLECEVEHGVGTCEPHGGR